MDRNGQRQGESTRSKNVWYMLYFIDRLPQPCVCTFLLQLMSEANTACLFWSVKSLLSAMERQRNGRRQSLSGSKNGVRDSNGAELVERKEND